MLRISIETDWLRFISVEFVCPVKVVMGTVLSNLVAVGFINVKCSGSCTVQITLVLVKNSEYK